MKKLLPYILILITIIGSFSIVIKAEAEDPLGTCLFSDFSKKENVTEKSCMAMDYAKGWEKNPITATPKDKTYHLLAPLPCTGDITTGCDNGQLTTFDPTGDNKIGAYLNLMIKLFIGICAVLAVVMIVMGGIEYMTTELISGKEAGKERILHAIFGLVLALGAWTLLNTINPDLLKSDLSSLKSVEVTVTLEDDAVPQTADATGKYPNSIYKKGDPWGDSIGAVQIFDNNKVIKNFPVECTTVGQSSCLSTRNLKPDNLNEVIAKCPNALPLKLNGGTEFWQHGGKNGNTTHGPGSPTIDLQSNSALNTCLSGGQPLKPNTMYGGKYYYEVNHWHVGLGK